MINTSNSEKTFQDGTTRDIPLKYKYFKVNRYIHLYIL